MRVLLATVLLPLSLVAQAQENSAETASETRTWTDQVAAEWRTAATTAADHLEAGLDGKIGLSDAIAAATETLGAGHSADRLRDALRSESADDALAAALERIVSDLRFTPTLEAELPLGFPATAPVGEVVLKSYPHYRMARTEMGERGGMSSSFWRLFQHIKQHDIAMTAPVQIDYTAGTESARQTESMAFLYGDPQLGATGAERQVEVVDIEPLLAISVGGRGYETREQLARLNARLEAWLTAHADEFEAAGPMRTMGYNSPMMPASKRFWEVEIPVRRRAPGEVSSQACASPPSASN